MSIYKPYHLFLLAGVLLLIGALIPAKETVDFHIHDTYIVLTHSSLFWIPAVLSYLFWGIYILTKNVLLTTSLTWIHLILTLAAIALFLCLPFFSNHRRYMELTPSASFDKFGRANTILAIIAFSFTIGQALLLVNITGGIFKWLMKR